MDGSSTSSGKWYIVTEKRWYIIAEKRWYIIAEKRWYIHARKLTGVAVGVIFVVGNDCSCLIHGLPDAAQAIAQQVPHLALGALGHHHPRVDGRQ